MSFVDYVDDTLGADTSGADTFGTPGSMQGVAPGRTAPNSFEPIYPPGDWGEPPAGMALPYDPHKPVDPNTPQPIPVEPVPLRGNSFYQDTSLPFDPLGVP
jgi:hypothetical protein